MSGLIVAVGSTRKPKLGAVCEASDAMADLLVPGASVEIVGVHADNLHLEVTKDASGRI